MVTTARGLDKPDGYCIIDFVVMLIRQCLAVRVFKNLCLFLLSSSIGLRTLPFQGRKRGFESPWERHSEVHCRTDKLPRYAKADE